MCPESIKLYARLVVENIPQQERIKNLKPGEFYSKARLSDLDWAGRKFLETALIMPVEDFQLDGFTNDTGSILKNAKQQVLQR